MEELIQTLSYPWAFRALLASSMVGILCGVLGCFIVLRNMALVGDALAHAILPGVVVAFIFIGYNTIGFFVGAVIAGLITAVGITWVQHNANTKNDAAIGIVFTAMFSIGVVGISRVSKNEGVHLDLKDFLFGNPMGVANEDLYLTAGITVYVILAIVLFYRYLFITTFQAVIAQTMGISTKMIHYFLMMLLSFAVVASLQAVGVILVVAMLITPASTALLLVDKLKVVIIFSGLIGCLSAVVGFILAVVLEAPPGPMMAIVATGIYMLAVLFSPKKGLLFRFISKQRMKSKIQIEDILKETIKLKPNHSISVTRIRDRLGYSIKKTRELLRKLKYQELALVEGNKIHLTEKGKEKATQLVRAHRLWETYLVNEMGLDEKQIHDDAEKYEHLLTEDILEEVDQILGFPTTDPHGSPIPFSKNLISKSLLADKVGHKGIISESQLNTSIISKLWNMGLMPGDSYEITAKTNNEISLKTENVSEVKIPLEWAKNINTTAK
jgi:ABC-type Mn2+/Zn2+ transport system permease subunit/Mn-dependent DtxR family transcriptional regulator